MLLLYQPEFCALCPFCFYDQHFCHLIGGERTSITINCDPDLVAATEESLVKHLDNTLLNLRIKPSTSITTVALATTRPAKQKTTRFSKQNLLLQAILL